MRTEAIGFARQAADDPGVIEGLAVPYGRVSNPTALTPGGEVVREAWAPGAFSASVAEWNAHPDGRRAPYRPRHGERPVGVVTALADTPDGVAFRASIFDTPAGREYLAEVAAGLNGVSIEGIWNEPPRRMRDGTVLHRSGKLYGIAGSDAPAYDGAHIALRDMEEAMAPEDTTAPEAVTTTTEAPAAERGALVQADPILPAIAPAASISITRPEYEYRPGTGNSFLRDLVLAKHGDSAAIERQQRHQAFTADLSLQLERAGELLSSEVPGAYPNEYVPGLLTPRIMKGRPMGGFFNRIGISDARPKVFAKVTTSGSVAVQAAEGTNPAATDIATTAVTATPLLYGAYIDVSRQVIDGADPSAQAMVYQDLIEAYAQASETVIKTAVEAGASASGAAITAATPFAGILANVVAYYGTRFKPADGVFIPSALFTTAMTQTSTGDGRPMWPYLNPSNADATVARGAAYGEVMGARAFLSYASTANVVVTARPEDYVIFESNVAQFSYDQVAGPAAIRLGIWAYLVVGARLGSLKVTAA